MVYCLSYIKCPSTVYIGETGRRLADRFREHRRDAINREEWPSGTCLLQSNESSTGGHEGRGIEDGPAIQDYRKKKKMRLIFKYGTMVPSGLNQDLSFTSITLVFAYSCAGAHYFMWHARERAIRYLIKLILTNFLKVFTVLYPGERRIAETFNGVCIAISKFI